AASISRTPLPDHGRGNPAQGLAHPCAQWMRIPLPSCTIVPRVQRVTHAPRAIQSREGARAPWRFGPGGERRGAMTLPPQFGRMRLPVVGAPMFIVSHPALVIAQCKAGIVGSFPALNARPTPLLRAWITQIRTELAAWDAAHP